MSNDEKLAEDVSAGTIAPGAARHGMRGNEQRRERGRSLPFAQGVRRAVRPGTQAQMQCALAVMYNGTDKAQLNITTLSLRCRVPS